MTFTLTGHITSDPKTFAPQNSDYTKLTFTVANNDRRVKQQDGTWKEEAVFIDVEYWTKNPQTWINKIIKGAFFASDVKDLRLEKWEHEGKQYSKIIVSCAALFPNIHNVEKRHQQRPQEQSATPWEDEVPF